MRIARHSALGLFAGVFLAACPLAALAQDGSPADGAQNGPMTVERIHTGFLVAPEFKVTRFAGRTSELVGGYGGLLYDQTFFLGGGGYWLANNDRDRKLAYGGVVVGWHALTDKRVGFNVKTLIGGGRATLSDTLGNLIDDDIRDNDRVRSDFFRHQPPGSLLDTTVRFREHFFIAEPEADVRIRLAKGFNLTGGVGYRLIGDAAREGDRIRGVTGSVALQIGG
jgi:hypothetical protein